LTGQKFTLTTSIDVGSPVGIGNSNSFQGASNYMQGQNYGYIYGTDPYGGYSPMSATLTIGGQAFTFDDHTGFCRTSRTSTRPAPSTRTRSSWGRSTGPPAAATARRFYGMAIDLTSAGAFGNDFTNPLPSMTSGFGTNYAVFYSSQGENIDLNITSINAVPEPSTWALMTMGFLVLGYLGYRRQSELAIA